MSNTSPNRLEGSDIHIDIETAEQAQNEQNSPQDKLVRVLPRLASRINSQAAVLAAMTPPESPSDEFKSIKERRKSRSTSVCIKPSELSPEIEELRTKDIQPDANSAAERALERAASVGAPHASNRDSTRHSHPEPAEAAAKPKQRVEGREIQQDHAQYALTYGMMLGIRVTTSRSDRALDRLSTKNGRATSMGSFNEERELTQRDFETAVELAFPPEGSSGSICPTPPHRLHFTFKFKDYMTNVFRAVRSLSGIDEEEYLRSLAGDFNYIEFIANSKSGQFFFYSHDGKYMIKTQSKEESLLLRRIMPRYVEHLNANPDSLLVRFYGMHRVKMKSLQSKIHFVIMSSVFDTEKSIHIKYDLKGSTIGRLTSEKDCAAGAVQKDLNLMHSDHKLRLGKENSKAFRETLEADVNFLRDLNIMDYSLLIGIHDGRSNSPGRRRSSVILAKHAASAGGGMPESSASQREGGGNNSMSIFQSYYGGIRSTREANEIYFIGIIDILQLYNTGKKFETFFKGLTNNRNELSSVNPSLYAKRMIDFIIQYTDYDEWHHDGSEDDDEDSERDGYQGGEGFQDDDLHSHSRSHSDIDIDDNHSQASSQMPTAVPSRQNSATKKSPARSPAGASGTAYTSPETLNLRNRRDVL